MRILLHIDDAEVWRAALAERLPGAEIVTSDAPAEARRDMDYLAVWKPPAELLREQPRLKGIVNLGAGVDALLGNPGLPEGVPIVKLRDAGSGQLREVSFLGPWDADLDKGRLDYRAGFARALMGRKVGETVTAELGGKQTQWEIVEVSPAIAAE